jgi:hypothetical protein
VLDDRGRRRRRLVHLLLFGLDVVAFSRGEGACTNQAWEVYVVVVVVVVDSAEEVAVRLVVVATCLEWRCAALLEISYCEQFCFPSVDSSVFSLFSWSEEGSRGAWNGVWP